MPLKLNLGQAAAVDLDASGDLARYFQPRLDTLIHFRPATLNFMGTRVSDVPPGSVSAGFEFSGAPSWTVTQAVGITLSIAPEAACTLAVLKPGDAVFSYVSAADEQETAVRTAPGRCYVSIALECSLAVDAGAKWSAGNFGVGGNIGTSERFRIAYC